VSVVAAFALLTLGLVAAPVAQADPASPLTVTNVANPSPVASGAELTYTITIVNTGGSKVSNLVLADQLNGVGTLQSPPATPQYAVTSTQGTCTQSGQLVTCNGGSLAGGATWTVTIRGAVTAPSGTTINNTATITGTRSAQNFTTNASVQTLVQGGTGGGSLPDLTINKTGPTTVVAGAAFDYVLTVNNIGTVATSNVAVTDTLPAGVALTSVTTTSLFVCTPTSGTGVTVVCTGGSVNAGQNATITLHVTAPPTGPLTNTASVDPDNSIAESNELNNTSATVNTSVTTANAAPPLTIVKTDDPAVIAGAGPDPVSPGGTLVYKVRVTNVGTTRADDVTVVDGTQGLEAASIVATQAVVNGTVGNGNGCFVSAPEVRCKIRTLNPGGTLTITITGTVIAPAGATLINTATVTGNVRNTGVTATATEKTTVKPAVDLTVTKSAAPDPVCARSWPHAAPGDLCTGGLVYTFVVGNSGIQSASNVVVRDVLPAGTIYDEFTNVGGADFTCTLSGGTLTCTNPSIAPESIESFTVTVVAPDMVGPLTNTVTVDPGNAIFEADETNNSASVTSQVSTGIDLTIFKFDEPGPTADPAGSIPAYPSPATGFDPIATSGTQTYTVYVDNLGPQNATDVRVIDTLPAGTTFLSATSDAGFTCTHDGAATGGVVTCVGGSLLGTEAEFYPGHGGVINPANTQFATIIIKAFATPFVQPVMHNEVRVDPLGAIAEINEANNIATQDTLVQTGGAGLSAFNQLTIAKAQTDPVPPTAVATNGILRYTLTIGNDGTDPVSNIVVKDFLPTGARFISAADTDPGPGTTDAFFCTHDGAATGGVITCIGGDLSGTVNTIPDTGGVGDVPLARQILITVYAPGTPGTYTNVAKVDPDNLVPEGNEFDNQAQASTTVTTAGNGGANSFHQLTIGKSATPTVATSSIITYTLSVANVGTDPSFGVAVRDTLPAGTTFISADDQAPGATQFTCSVSGQVVTCSGATLSGTATVLPGAPATRTIVITAFAPNRPMIVTNTAYVDPDNTIPEGDETDNAASASTVVTVGAGFIDLSVTKCDGGPCPTDGNPVQMNAPITYTVTVTNNGTDPAFQVSLRDILPAGVTFVSAVDQAGGNGSFLCGYSDGVVTCTGATLDGSLDLIAGVPTERVVLVTVMPPQQHGLVITNQAFVDPANTIAESNETNNYAVDTSLVVSPFDVSLDKEGPTTAHQNNTEDYTITVTNNGAAVTDVVVEDPLPTGLIVLGATATPSNFTCQVFENPVNFVRCVGDMGATGSDTATVTITVHVFVTQDGGTLDNEACVDPANTIIESNEANNCDTKSSVVDVFRPNVAVHKSASVGSATIGQTFSYTVTASNIGDATAAAGWSVDDVLPSEVDFVSASGNNGGTCVHDGSASGGTLTCTPTALAPGEQETYTIAVRVNASATSAFTNTASVSGSVDADAAAEPCLSSTCGPETSVANNSDAVTVSAGGPAINLVVGDITDLPDPAEQGDAVTYTVVVTNGGTQDALAAEGHEVVVRVNVPTVGVTLGATVGTQGFLCVATAGDSIVTCTGDLNGSESTTLSITILTTGTTPPQLDVTVTADPANAITETSETDNVATEKTTVTSVACTGCIDLVLGQISADPNPGVDGAQVTYKFAVTNIGDLSTATDPDTLVVAINLDSSFNESSFESGSGTNGFTCALNPFFGGGLGQSTANPEILCTASASGLNPGQGSLITIVTNVNTAATPSFVGFDVAIDPGDVVGEDTNANNDGGLQIDVVAP
jgi:uncharacterized repeat protein (TIGR01451 family)